MPRFLMPFALVAASVALLAGCGMAPAGTAADGSALAAAAKPKVEPEVENALSRFTEAEGREVSARHVTETNNPGGSASELYTRLAPQERSLLLQLYRLHPKPLAESEWPKGLRERAVAHFEALYRFHYGAAAPKGLIAKALQTRCYRDGENNVLAYESYWIAEKAQLFGKYNLKGKILKIDIEAWN